MAVVSATTTGGTSATPVGLSSLGSSLKLPPVTSVLVPEQSINDALATLLLAIPTTELSVVPGIDVSSAVPPDLSEVVPGVDVSSAVPPDLSEVVPGGFDVSVEPHLELDATLSGWSGAEDVSFSATPVSPEMMQLGRQLASTVEERTARQIQTGVLFVCDWPPVDGV